MTAKPKAATSRTNFYQNYERAVLHFPRAHSITQAVGDSAVTVSRDQESELMSSLRGHVKSPKCFN